MSITMNSFVPSSSTIERIRGRKPCSWVCGTLVALLSIGCGERPLPPGRPHDVVELNVKDKRLIVEVACDEGSRALGLMRRSHLPENHGMVFIYPSRRVMSFWMKNTTIPLSIAFISDEGVIQQVEDMEPNELRTTRSTQMLRYALEVNQGWFERNQVGVGDRIVDFDKLQRFVISP